MLRKQEVITQQAGRTSLTRGTQPDKVSGSSSTSGIGSMSYTSHTPTSAPPQQEGGGIGMGGFSLNFARPGGSKTTSAPTSPSKTRESFLQRVSSITGAVRGEIAQHKPSFNKDRCFTLLVIDDQNTDWSKYFRGKKIHTDWDIRVEQAEFKELNTTSSSETGVNVSMVVYRNNAKVVRSFKPDFVLVRQNMKDAGEDHKNVLLALKYGSVPSINSLTAIYNFQDKPWVFSHLLEIQKKIGKENFPLIDQCYFPNHKEMLTSNRFPCVLKIGQAHGGLGKVKVESNSDFQDMASVVAVANTYCTTEPFVNAKFDIHIQKIGGSYKCFQRKSISGNWKTNIGSAMLEQTAMTERYKIWVDQVANLFGGLDICSIEAIVDKNGGEHIIEVNDSALPLMGDTQEDDRRYIAELVATKMQDLGRTQARIHPPDMNRPAPRQSTGSAIQTSRGSSPTPETTPSKVNSTTEAASTVAAAGGSPGAPRRDSQTSQSSSMSGFSSASTTKRPLPDDPPLSQSPPISQPPSEPPPPPPRPGHGRQSSTSNATEEDTDDTMKNLRKTFAGIFGDM